MDHQRKSSTRLVNTNLQYELSVGITNKNKFIIIKIFSPQHFVEGLLSSRRRVFDRSGWMDSRQETSHYSIECGTPRFCFLIIKKKKTNHNTVAAGTATIQRLSSAPSYRRGGTGGCSTNEFSTLILSRDARATVQRIR